MPSLQQSEEKIYDPIISELQFLLASEMNDVNKLIINKMTSPVTLIPELGRHLIMAGGKRLRPLLMLAAAKLCGYEGKNHILLATSIEFIHTATLLHDDVVDESNMRRGQDAANEIWGNQASVLVGDFLFSKSFELMVENGCLEILKILSSASSTIAEGEVAQLITTNNLATTEQDYLKIINAKTAILFAAAAQIGAILGKLPNEKKLQLDNFGRNLGLVFQLVDDVIDYTSETSQMGKNTGDDLKEGKVTLPIIHAYKNSNQMERDFLLRVFEKSNHQNKDFSKVIELMTKYGSIEYTYKFAKNYAIEAHAILDKFPDSPIQNSLHQLIEFSLQRVY